MNTIKFNNVQDFKDWVEENVSDNGVVCEMGEIDEPIMYPCIMAYELTDKFYCECADEEEEYDRLRKEGYYSDEIEKLKYRFVYPTDFD